MVEAHDNMQNCIEGSILRKTRRTALGGMKMNFILDSCGSDADSVSGAIGKLPSPQNMFSLLEDPG